MEEYVPEPGDEVIVKEPSTASHYEILDAVPLEPEQRLVVEKGGEGVVQFESTIIVLPHTLLKPAETTPSTYCTLEIRPL